MCGFLFWRMYATREMDVLANPSARLSATVCVIKFKIKFDIILWWHEARDGFVHVKNHTSWLIDQPVCPSASRDWLTVKNVSFIELNLLRVSSQLIVNIQYPIICGMIFMIFIFYIKMTYQGRLIRWNAVRWIPRSVTWDCQCASRPAGPEWVQTSEKISERQDSFSLRVHTNTLKAAIAP